MVRLAIYESMLIFSGRMEPQAVDQELEKVRALIESGSGSLHSVERMGRRRLAYDIRKESDGHYAVLHFEGEPSRVQVLQRAFRLNESILRFMVFRKERLPEGPTVTLEEEEPHGEGGYHRREERGEGGWRGERGDRAAREGRGERRVRGEHEGSGEAGEEEGSAGGSDEED
jgi:small subunit ribosomal protein S6